MKTVKMTELQKQMVVVGFFAVLLLLLGVWAIILPAFKKSAQLRHEISQIGKKQELLKQIQENEARIQNLQSSLLQEKDRHLILSHVTTLANRAGLEVDSVNPEKTDNLEKGVYAPFLVRMRASGTFQKLLVFLTELERKKPKLMITEMELVQTKNTKGDSAELSISLAAQTLLLK